MRNSIRTAGCMAALLLLATSLPAAAQPVITGATFLDLRGESQMVIDANYFPGSITVDVGNSGANQTWDLSTLSLTGDTYTRSFLDPADTPYANEFPTANFVFATMFTSDTLTINLYQYSFVDNSGFSDIGAVWDYGDSTSVEPETSPETIALPVGFGTSWTEISRDTLAFDTVEIISVDSTVTTADAWGNLTLDLGTIPVLRLKGEEFYTSVTYVNGVPFQSSSSSYITYEFISPDHFIVASISSTQDETDPNFTEAENVQLLTAITTSTDQGPAERTAGLREPYPNPFTESLTIDFETDAAHVDLAVYDILGRRVRTLVAPGGFGLRTATWDGRNESGARVAEGLYLVRLHAGGQVETRRVVLNR